MPDRFVGIDAKIERAKELISQLQAEQDLFFASEPYLLFAYSDLETRQGRIAVNVMKEVPTKFSTIIGDILVNLRAALDYLMHEITDYRGNEHLSFPISSNEYGFKAAVRGVKKLILDKSIRAPAMQALRAANAYKGGKGHGLWQLHELNNLNKHRLLVPVGSAVASFGWDAGAYMRKTFAGLEGMEWVQRTPSTNILIGMQGDNRNYPLQDGTVVLGFAQHEVDFKYKIAVELAFGEGQIVEGEPLFPTLLKFTQLVEATVEPFRPLLS